MNRIKSAYSLLEYDEFQKQEKNDIEKTLNNGRTFKMPKNAQELIDTLKSICN